MSGNANQNKSNQVVLLSGGLDSAVNLAMAVDHGGVLLTLTFDYGQHAAIREIGAARALSSHYGVPHRVIALSWMKEMSSGALVEEGKTPPQVGEAELSDGEATRQSARAVWVPNRNGIFLNMGAAFAEAAGGGTVVAGFNREEAATFPDNSKAFLQRVNEALVYSTLQKVRVHSYTGEMDKKEILERGLGHGVPLQMVWSCYLGGEQMCGRCESCQRFKRAASGSPAEETTATLFRE